MKRRRVSLPGRDQPRTRPSKSAELIDKENRNANIVLGFESNDTTALPAMKKRRGSIIATKDKKERKSIGRRVSFSHTVDVRLIKAAEEQQKSKDTRKPEPRSILATPKQVVIEEYKEAIKGDSPNASRDSSSEDMDMTANITQGTIILSEDGQQFEDGPHHFGITVSIPSNSRTPILIIFQTADPAHDVTVDVPMNMDLTANLTQAINSVIDNSFTTNFAEFDDDFDHNMTINGPVTMDLTANLTQAIIEATGFDFDQEAEEATAEIADEGLQNMTINGQINMDLTANHTQFLVEDDAASASVDEDLPNDRTINNLVNMDMTEVSFDDFIVVTESFSVAFKSNRHSLSLFRLAKRSIKAQQKYLASTRT